MTPVTDETLERRRIQNRMAQRRFRQRKQEHRKVPEFEGPILNGASSLNSEAASLDTHLENSATSPTRPPLSPVDLSSSPRYDSGMYSRYSLPDNSSYISLGDVDSGFAQYAAVTPVPCGLPISPAGSMTVTEILESDVFGGPGGESSTAQSGNACNLLREKSPEPTGTATELIEPSNLGSSVHSCTSTAIDAPSTGTAVGTPSMGTATKTGSRSGSSNSGWLSALHMAAQRGHGGIVRVLLQQNMDSNERDSDGLTPLMHAAAGGHDEVASVLLAHGARLGDVDGRRRSALHWAVLTYREALLRLLLKHAASDPFLIDAYDDAGRTPLHTAVDSGFEHGVTVLLEYGANLHSRARKS